MAKSTTNNSNTEGGQSSNRFFNTKLESGILEKPSEASSFYDVHNVKSTPSSGLEQQMTMKSQKQKSVLPSVPEKEEENKQEECSSHISTSSCDVTKTNDEIQLFKSRER